MSTATGKLSLSARLLALSITLSVATTIPVWQPYAAFAAGQNQQAALLNNEGVKLLSSQNFPGAIQKFEEALRIEPGYKFAVENLSIAYNNYALKLPAQEALKLFHKALALNPSNQTTQQNLDSLVSSIGKNPRSFKDRQDLAKQARLSGDFDGAIAEYISALRVQNDGKTHLDLGNVYRVKDRVDEAINEYKAALAAGGLQRPALAEVNKNLGESYQQKKDIKSAIAAYADAIKADPTNRDVIDALIAGWEEAINENPKSADNHIGLGQAYQLKGDFGQAKAEYDQALLWDKNSTTARTLLQRLPEAQRSYEITKHINAGVDLQVRKDFDRAISEYMEAIKGDPNNIDVWINLGSCLQQKGDYERAIKAYQRALVLKPNNEEAKTGLKACEEELAATRLSNITKQAEDLYRQGRYPEALNLYRQIAQKTPNDAGLHFNMAACLQNMKDIDAAIAEYKLAASLDKKNAEYAKSLDVALGIKAQPIIDRAVEAHKNKDYLNAIELYQQAINLVPKRTELHYDLASAYYSRQQYDLARAEYQKALEQDRKGQINDLYFLGTIDEHYGKGYDAMDKYRKYIAESPGGAFAKPSQDRIAALTKNPNDTQKIKSEDEVARAKEADDAYRAAVKFQGEKQYDQAVQMLERALKLDPKQADFVYVLATVLVQKGDIDAGLKYFDQAIAMEPGNKDYKKYRDLALEQKADQLVNNAVEKQKAGDYAGAISLYNQAISIAPKVARIYSNLASALYASDDFNGALNAYKKALEVDPKQESINWYSVAAIDEHYNRGAQALDEYRKFILLNPTDKLADSAKARVAALMKNAADTKKLPTHGEAIAINQAQEIYDSGVKLQEGGQLDEALQMYIKAMSLNPKEAAYPFAAGSVFQAKKDLTSASKYYAQAAQLDPQNETYKKYTVGVKAEQAGPLIDQAAQKYQAGDFAGAISLYRQALEMVPNDSNIHTDLASALQGSDDFNGALAEYKKAFELDPKGAAETQYFVAALEEHFGNGQGALRDYRDYMTKNPKGKFIDYAKNRMAALSKNPADVQKLQTSTERQQSTALAGAYDEAVGLQQAGKFDEAEAKYSDLMLKSNDASYAYARGTNYQAKGEYAKAIEMYQRAVKGDPQNQAYAKTLQQATAGQTSLLMGDGIKKYNSKDFAGSIEAFKSALIVAPKNAKLHTAMGASYQAMDNFQAARDEYQKGFDLDQKGEVDNLYFMGPLDETLGKGKVALQDYTKYLQYAPNGAYKVQANARYQELYFHPEKVQKLQTQADAQVAEAANQAFNEAVQLQTDNKLDEAIAKYKEALQASPNSDSVHYSLGTAYQGKGEYESALREYEDAIRLNAKEATYKKTALDLKLAMAGPFVSDAIAKQTGKDDKGNTIPVDLPGAIGSYLKALKLAPDDAGTHKNLGTAYQQNKDLTKAIGDYQRAITLDPKDAETHYFLATAYDALNQPKNAALEYRKYLQLAPAGPYANEIKERLKILKL